MKIYFDTKTLIDITQKLISDKDNDSVKLLNTLINTDPYTLWMSALSLIHIEDILSKKNKKKKNYFLEIIKTHFAIIPFRDSLFNEAIALKNNKLDLLDNINYNSAKSFNIDYYISLNLNNYSYSDVPIFTPSDFLNKINNESEDIQKVDFLDITEQYHQIYNEIDNNITKIIAKSAFILGEPVKNFEKTFANKQEANFCLAVSSGTDALHTALLAIGIGHGDSVIVPVNTFFATAEAVSLTGAEPEFIDCNEFYNIDEKKLENRIEDIKNKSSKRLKAIIPVHLYGQPANINKIINIAHKHGLKVIEDCCQAHLAKINNKMIGNFGEFGAFSFYPGKNLGAFGEAGALITKDKHLFDKAKKIRQHGEIKKYSHELIGHNYRMEAIQAAVLNVKLNYLNEWTVKRRKNAQLYTHLLSKIEEVRIPQELKHTYCVYHLYVIRVKDRDSLQKYLSKNGIATGLHYPLPLHIQKAYQYKGHGNDDFPFAMKFSFKILSLPMYPELNENQIIYVCKTINNFYKERKRYKYEE